MAKVAVDLTEDELLKLIASRANDAAAAAARGDDREGLKARLADLAALATALDEAKG